MRDPSEIRCAVEAFARSPNGGLIVTASALALHHRDLITMLAVRNRLPAVYSEKIFGDDEHAAAWTVAESARVVEL
jgi:putative ABC transport system substrate-binding protein